MENKILLFKGGVAAVFSAIAMLLGWRGILALVWIAAMMLDYISGSLAARKTGEWSSKIAREGIWHKAGMILVVIVAAMADYILVTICKELPGMGIQWPVAALPVVLAWYILTELGSILENAVRMGANVPAWLIKGLEAGKKTVEGFATKKNDN